MDTSEPMTYAEAARYLGLTQSALRSAISRGDMTPYRPFRSRLKMLHRADVERYKRGERPSTRAEVRPGSERAEEAPKAMAEQDIALVTIGDKFVALAVAVAAAVAPALRDAYRAYYDYKIAEAQGGPLNEAMREINRGMASLGERAKEEGVTEDILDSALDVLTHAMPGAPGEGEPWSRESIREYMLAQVMKGGALTTPADMPTRERVKASA